MGSSGSVLCRTTQQFAHEAKADLLGIDLHVGEEAAVPLRLRWKIVP